MIKIEFGICFLENKSMSKGISEFIAKGFVMNGMNDWDFGVEAVFVGMVDEEKANEKAFYNAFGENFFDDFEWSEAEKKAFISVEEMRCKLCDGFVNYVCEIK